MIRNASFVNIKCYFSALKIGDLFFFDKGKKMYKVVSNKGGLVEYRELIQGENYIVSKKNYSMKKIYLHLKNNQVEYRFKTELALVRSGKKLRR